LIEVADDLLDGERDGSDRRVEGSGDSSRDPDGKQPALALRGDAGESSLSKRDRGHRGLAR
jgi:hypothetical protein